MSSQATSAGLAVDTPQPDQRLARVAMAVGKPLLHAATVAVCVAIVTFFLIRALLGDPARRLAGLSGQVASPQQVAALRAQLGLNRGLLAQFASYMTGLAHGDFGTSFQYRGTPVSSIVFGTLGNTVILAITTMLISAALGIALGLFCAAVRSRLVDNLTRILSMIAMSAPSALVGLVLILSVAVRGSLLPAGGWGTGYPGDFRYLVLPIVTLCVWFTPVIFRVVRERAVEVLREPHVEAACARGMPPMRLALRHVLPNCALPVLNIVALSTGGLLGGAVIVETVFGVPGLGQTMSNAINSDDFPVIQAVTLLSGLAVVLANTAADIAGRAIDPRTRA
jgi:peptide/nickel transport system permease protein